MREIARRLATLGHIRLKKGSPLNVRRRETVRRTLAEAGESLGWSEVAATSDDPVKVVRRDVKKMLRSGLRSLKRGAANELAETEADVQRLEEVVESVKALADDPDAEFPIEITYARPARDHATGGYMTKEDTLSLEDAEEARKAALRLERSLPRWQRLREQLLADMRQHQESLAEVGGNVSYLVDGWGRLMREVLVVMH